MISFIDRVKAAEHETLFWLGQAGFLIKTADGKRIAIDPYMSDYTEKMCGTPGYKRLNPPPCDAEELCIDALLISHEHEDHLDMDSMAAFFAYAPMQAYCSMPTYKKLEAWGADMSRVHLLQMNVPVELCGGVTLMPLDCDHGPNTPDALGFLLTMPSGKTVYYTGDSSLSPDRLQKAVEAKPELALVPINGAFGNMNGEEAAQYAAMLGCKKCMAYHFWTFANHHGDPGLFLEAMEQHAPDCQPVLLCHGEGLEL